MSNKDVTRVVGAFLCGLAISQISACSHDLPFVNRMEAVLLQSVVTGGLPSYPVESIKHSSHGVTVSELRIDESGRVTSVAVLEAPDKHIAASIEKALSGWRFTPISVTDSGQFVRVRGKITLYFELREGQGYVLTAKERTALMQHDLGAAMLNIPR